MNGRKQPLLWLLAFVKFLLPFLLVHPSFELHRDEFLYLAEAGHLDWGYLEAPPLLSVMAWLSRLPGGTNEYWVRFWPALFGALTFLVAGKMVVKLGGKTLALTLLFLSFVFTAFLRLHFLFQPNILDVFFWTLCSYWLFSFIREGKNDYLYLLGISAGLGFLGKYSIVIFLAALVPALLFSRQRSLFAGRHLYLAGGLGLLIALPNLVWQYLHNFPVLHHMEELHETQLRYIEPLSFLAEQLLMTLPVFFVWMAGCWYSFFHHEGRKYRVFGLAYLLVILLLILLKGKAYYALGSYPVLLALGAYYLEELSASSRRIRYVAPAFILLTGIPLIPVLLPIWEPARLAGYYKASGLNQTGILQWEDRRDHHLPQDYADMLGWEEVARKTIAAVEKIPAPDRKTTVVIGSNYGLAGAINYYGGDRDLPESISTSASFLLWIPRFSEIRHVIWVGDGDPEGFAGLFDEVILLDSVTHSMARERGTRIRWFRRAAPGTASLVNAEIRRLQQRFRRP